MALLAACRTSRFSSVVKWKRVATSVSSFLIASKHTAVQDSAQAASVDVQFTVFYRFPYITAARFIQRLKLYQTGFVVSAVPPAVYAYNIDAIGLEPCIGAFAVSTLALIMLYIATNFFQRVVGLVSLSNDQKLVRLSHLTFFGGRNDLVVPVDDVVPLSDSDERSDDIFVKVHRYSTSDTLYMTLRYGQIENAETFKQVFGIV